ncbi:MAG: hypothetical protein NZM04_11125 [Methylacidiphilales bacterium]|nr:hypothetical protein [Candidatus Methylacidiphilales bacterium]
MRSNAEAANNFSTCEDKQSGVMAMSHRLHEYILGNSTAICFLQPALIGFDACDVNWYRYVGNNAVNYTDPEGLMVFEQECLDKCEQEGRKCESRCGLEYLGRWRNFNPVTLFRQVTKIELVICILGCRNGVIKCKMRCYKDCDKNYDNIA